MLEKKIEEFISAAERMRLGEYVRFESDRKRRLADAFWQGVLRGVGAVIGFAVVSTMIVYILQSIAQRSLPVISDFVADIIRLVQLRIN